MRDWENIPPRLQACRVSSRKLSHTQPSPWIYETGSPCIAQSGLKQHCCPPASASQVRGHSIPAIPRSFIFHRENEVTYLPPVFASILANMGPPALLETVVPQETLCAVSLSANYQRLQAPDTRQTLELTVLPVGLTGLVVLTSPQGLAAARVSSESHTEP